MLVQAMSDIGLKRKNNQDSFFYDADKGIYVIADGMGGYAGGEIASSIAVNVFREGFQGLDGANYRAVLDALLQKANEAVLEKARENSDLEGMGTTLLALATVGRAYFLAYVGDSRAYLIRETGIFRLTDDHNVSGELMREGHLTEKEAMHHPGKNMLTRVLGRHPELKAEYRRGELTPGERILLCSDGLTGLVESQEIWRMVRESESLKEALNEMVRLALDRGGDDNITAILLQNCEENDGVKK